MKTMRTADLMSRKGSPSPPHQFSLFFLHIPSLSPSSPSRCAHSSVCSSSRLHTRYSAVLLLLFLRSFSSGFCFLSSRPSSQEHQNPFPARRPFSCRSSSAFLSGKITASKIASRNLPIIRPRMQTRSAPHFSRRFNSSGWQGFCWSIGDLM